MKRYLLELTWLMGIVIIYLIGQALVSHHMLGIPSTVTYQMNGGVLRLGAVAANVLLLAFSIFLGRAIIQKFRQVPTNLVLLCLNALIIYILSFLTHFFYLSKGDMDHRASSSSSFYGFMVITILLLMLEIFVGYQILRILRAQRSKIKAIKQK